MFSRLVILLVVLLAGVAHAQEGERLARKGAATDTSGTAKADPVNHWGFDYESGILWKAGGGTPLSYLVLPQLFTWKSPATTHLPFAGGEFVLRSRFSLLLEPIVRGPEKYYIGASAAGCLEWWNWKRTTSYFFSGGGGLGVMHSKGYQIAGGQGQDLNFNWLAYLGARKSWKPGLSASLGLYFQHISNTGLDKINPGLNALGPMVGVAWRY